MKKKRKTKKRIKIKHYNQNEISKISEIVRKRDKIKKIDGFIKEDTYRVISFFQEIFGFNPPSDAYRNGLELFFSIEKYKYS